MCPPGIAVRRRHETHCGLSVLGTPTGVGTRPAAGLHPQSRDDRTAQNKLGFGQTGDDAGDRRGTVRGEAVCAGSSREQRFLVSAQREMLMGARPDAVGKRLRRQAHPHAVPTGHSADQDSGQNQLIGRGDRRTGRKRDLELVHTVFGMELFHPDPRALHRGHRVADETLMLEHACQSVLRPQFPR